MDQIIPDTRKHMQKILEVLHGDLATIRTGRATSSLVEDIVVEAYGGTRLKIKELATIATSDTQTLLITPFDASVIGDIKKGILEANTGLNPIVDGPVIRITIPPLSEERRQQLIHLMKQKLENGRIMVRQARHEAMDTIKKQFNEKLLTEDDKMRLEKEVQKVTDETTGEIEAMGKRKEEELLQI